METGSDGTKLLTPLVWVVTALLVGAFFIALVMLPQGALEASPAVKDAFWLFSLIAFPLSLASVLLLSIAMWAAVRWIPLHRLLSVAFGLMGFGLIGVLLYAIPFTRVAPELVLMELTYPAWGGLTIALPSAAVIGYAALGSRPTLPRLLGIGALTCVAGTFVYAVTGILVGAETD